VSDPAELSADERADHGWWEARRGRYLASLVASSIASFLVYCAVVELCGRTHAGVDVEITLFSLAGQAMAFAVALAIANACYGLGAVVERRMKPRDGETFRRRLYALGFVFSVALPWAIPASLAVECIRAPRSGEHEFSDGAG
jgi:hypothetical protein